MESLPPGWKELEVQVGLERVGARITSVWLNHKDRVVVVVECGRHIYYSWIRSPRLLHYLCDYFSFKNKIKRKLTQLVYKIESEQRQEKELQLILVEK